MWVVFDPFPIGARRVKFFSAMGGGGFLARTPETTGYDSLIPSLVQLITGKKTMKSTKF